MDVAETTGHVARWRADLELLASCGVTRLRYPVRWHRIQADKRGGFDWRSTDEVLGWMRDHGMRPIVDLCHHTSYPRWLKRGFADRKFTGAYLAYVEAFATRYPWVQEYTLFNEPFTTFLLCGQMGVWPPYMHGLRGFLTLARNVLPALTEADRVYRDLVPGARHFYVETCERASAAVPDARGVAAEANDRRFFILDLFLGREMDPTRPFVSQALAAGGPLPDLRPGKVDVLGLDYYAHNQWQYQDRYGRGLTTSPDPGSLADLIIEYWDRYRIPCALGETNIRGFAPDRASWLKYTLEQCELAQAAGVPMDSYCWFPFVDSCDWDSMLVRNAGNVDPVGVYWLDERLERRPSSMSRAYAQAARGAGAADLPAYRFQPPVSGWLAGWLPQMAHWDWQEPPAAEVLVQQQADDRMSRRIRDKGV